MKLFAVRLVAWSSIAVVVYAALLSLLARPTIAGAVGFAGPLLLIVAAYRLALRSTSTSGRASDMDRASSPAITRSPLFQGEPTS